MVREVNIDKEYLEELYLIDEKTLWEISKIFGVAEATIFNKLKKYSTSMRSQSEVMKKKFEEGYQTWNKGLTKENSKKVKEMYAEGINKECPICRRIFYCRPCEVERIVCSRECSNEHVSNKMKGYLPKNIDQIKGWNKGLPCPERSGANCIFWKGGKSFEPYTKEFNNTFKGEIRKRDNEMCMLCGISAERLDYSLHVHHINYDKKLTMPKNSISLCIHCHAITNSNREYWTKFFQSLLHDKYNYDYNDITHGKEREE